MQSVISISSSNVSQYVGIHMPVLAHFSMSEIDRFEYLVIMFLDSIICADRCHPLKGDTGS